MQLSDNWKHELQFSTNVALARRLGLVMAAPESLTIRRYRQGKGWRFANARGRTIRDAATLARLRRLAMPPAYEDVFYAADPKAHLQAVGRDNAGRLQYRYHPDWEKARNLRKAQHLASLASCLPRIRQALAARLKQKQLTKEFALAAVTELTAIAAIRAGSEEYAKAHQTRGAATLLKRDVRQEGDVLFLSFRAKGGKQISKQVKDALLCAAIRRLRTLPGARLFQYRAGDAIHPVAARDVNLFLKEIAGEAVSLKDFRTLCATSQVLCALAGQEPATSVRGRKAQINAAIAAAAQALENTPAVCRRSYVHAGVLEAFEKGQLTKLAPPRQTSGPTAIKAVLRVLKAA
jgi:DNA topoisomerase I